MVAAVGQPPTCVSLLDNIVLLVQHYEGDDFNVGVLKHRSDRKVGYSYWWQDCIGCCAWGLVVGVKGCCFA